MNNIKRFLTLFLALVMCFSLVPESVFAADKITGEEVKESVVEKETATSSEEKTIVEESEEKTLNGEEKSVEPNSEVSVNITSEDGTDMDVCEISAGETLQLIATVAPNNITWSSSDITVLTVNETGLSTAVAEGTATVTVTADNEGEISDSVLFAVVSNENAEVFEKEKSDVDIAIGESTEEKTAETEITKNTTEEGFSYYTVEFTYNKRQYVLEGDTEAALEEILEYLGISGEVETAISDAPDLFDVENGNVISKQAFNTEQKLTVKMTDGQIYEIVVTDNVYINKSSLSVRYPTDEEIAEYVQEYIDACGIKSITELDEENYESAQYWNGYLYSNSEVRAKNGKIPDAIKIIENNEEKTKYIQKNIDYKHESHNYLLEKTDNKEYASTLSTHKCSNDKSGHGYDTGDYSYRWYGVYGKDADGETVSTSGSSQCAGFASYMLYVIYHADKDDSHLFKTITSFSKYSPEPGDYIRDGTHSFVVYKVEGGKVHTIQCNANIANGIGTCMIYTKKYSSISDFKSILGAGDYVWRLKNKNPDIRETVQTYVKIRANREGNNIKDKPFEGDSCNVVRAMVYGETYIATKIVKNNKDNYWYYVPELKGYVSANAVEYVDHAEDKMITFEDTVITKKNPGTYDLPGRMTQPGNVTIKLTAEIIPSDSDKSVQSSTREFSGKINYLCSKKGGASSCGSLCNNLKFKELPNNTLYCYKLTAKYTLYHCKSNDDKADLIAETREEINESWFKFGKVSDTWSVTYNMNGQGKQISAQTVIKGKQAKNQVIHLQRDTYLKAGTQIRIVQKHIISTMQ